MSGADDPPPPRAEPPSADLGREDRDDVEPAHDRDPPELGDDLRRLRAAHETLYENLLAARPAAEEIPPPSLLERLRSEFGPDVDPGASIQGEPPGDSAFSREVVARLSLRSGSFGRYTVGDEIARGGMGTVLRVWDEDLRRSLAMKLVRARRGRGAAAPDAVGSRTLGRFLEEAQITGQLDHPGIVPVHELGLDAEGRVYFTMKLVEGRTLQAVFEELARGEGGWTQTRVLGLILKVCEAMSYAHAKGVIHRDLKPANVMVGKFGEVYVMDWGLARVLGREDRKDIRLRPPEPVEGRASAPSLESPLLTMDGDVVGTPAYMPPEQARGEVERLDERTDVYALGAMLYQLLTGRVPYLRPGERPGWHALLARVLEGPPQPVAELAPRAPVELVAVCEKAMARTPDARYPDMSALAEDLSAFVEGRVVRAYETGTWAETRKWVRRNRALAASLAAGILGILGGGVAFAVKADQATGHAARAEAETAKVLRLSDAKVLQQLEREADDLWPPHPGGIAELESWLLAARKLADRLPGHRETLADMQARAGPWTEEERTQDRETHPRAGELAAWTAELEGLMAQLDRGLQGEARERADERVLELEPGVRALAEEVESRRTWSFEAQEEQWQHDVLAELVEDLEVLEAGLLAPDAITIDHGWSVPMRLAFARHLEEGFAGDGLYTRAWSEALPFIREAYPGLELTPQMGLVPVGPDPRSGLWEFAHLMSGEPPERGPDGDLVLDEDCAIVLVLLPGGDLLMGAQRSDPTGPNYDAEATIFEGPLHSVTLSPCFVSKYEMTQGQWLRLRSWNPSLYEAGLATVTLLHPVEQVTWPDCVTTLRMAGLTLPSEAQWEYAARAGTTTTWWTGSDPESLSDPVAENLADRSASQGIQPLQRFEEWLDDGYALHSPVGAFEPNPFGLHDVHGNVWEWCLDGYQSGFYATSPERDPVGPPHPRTLQVVRGGCYMALAHQSGSGLRTNGAASNADGALGVRPARPLKP